MKALETSYAGHRFRSRCEARWAVAFDAYSIEWEYEQQGFDLGELGPYLPDFWLPQVNMWAEVKGSTFSQVELAKARALANQSGYAVLLLSGAPDFLSYWAIHPSDSEYGDCCNYDLWDMSEYHLDEGRLFAMPGCLEWRDFPEPCVMDYWAGDTDSPHPVIAAKGARFEHGEQFYRYEGGHWNSRGTVG